MRSDFLEKGILNQELLERNIENIKYYLEEEYKYINKIYDKLNESSKYYCSFNTNLILEVIYNLPDNAEFLKNKREKYVIVLNKNIIKYNNLSIETKRIFNDWSNKNE